MKKRKITHKLLSVLRKKPLARLSLVLIITLVGVLLVVLTKAATPTSSIQAEAGTLGGSATKLSSSAASGGQYVKFNTTAPPTGQGRNYPDHTNINATTFWVGEYFQAGPDGSQACSAYDGDWIYSHFRLAHAVNCQMPSGLSARAAGCDALLANESGKCNDSNSIGSLRTPANGYFPAGLQTVYENPFYLDLPYNDLPAYDGFVTGWSDRCQKIPWANDPGWGTSGGRCTNEDFSYMKNRWVKIWANGRTCYGQIEDAGPADYSHGNPNYADYNYVFGSNDARPANTSYDDAGMDISPALNACLGGQFNQNLNVNWEFVDDIDVPATPWKVVTTTSQVNW